MCKHPDIIAATREDFMTAFCLLYAKRPIEQISVKDITALAGYNRSTFYLHFSGAEDLRRVAEDTLLTDWRTACGAGSLPDVRRLAALFSDKEIFWKAVLGDYGSAHFIARLRETMYPTVLSSSPAADALAPYRTELRLAALLALLRVWLRRGRDLPPDALAELARSLCAELPAAVPAVQAG